MRFKKYWIPVIIMVFWGIGGCNSKESGSAEAPLKSQNSMTEERMVEVEEVVPKSISYTLSAIGTLKAPENVILSPKEAGIIDRILVKEGDRVRKGQVLVQLNDVDARLQVERAEARVQEAAFLLEASRILLLRYQKLLEKKVIPQQTYDDIRLRVKVEEARLALAKAELNLASQSVLDHRIVSPIEGIVNLKIASLGEHVNVAPKDEILSIVQMDPLELEFYVPENWVGKIRLGSAVQFRVEAFSKEKFLATLQFISPTADPSTRNVKIKAVAQNPYYRLKPGFFAEVTFQTGTNPNALIIPESALFSQEGRYFVFMVRDEVAYRKEVETGHRFDGKVEILKGIQKGERVVTAGYEQLTDGMRVRMTESTRTKSLSQP